MRQKPKPYGKHCVKRWEETKIGEKWNIEKMWMKNYDKRFCQDLCQMYISYGACGNNCIWSRLIYVDDTIIIIHVSIII